MEAVRRLLQMDGCFTVDCMGLSGGIALLWRDEWCVNIINYTKWHVSALIQEKENGPTWQFTGFYGHPDTGKRGSSWQLLKMLKPTTSIAWLCAGDFNEILHRVIRFTWSNNRNGNEFTKEKIDRVFGNNEWIDLFRHGVYNVLPAISSDHSPLSVSLHNTSNGRKKRRWCFRYEMAWEVKEECLKVVGEAWQNAGITDCQAKSLRTQLDLGQKGLMTWRQTLKQQEDQIVKNGILNIGHLQNYGTGEHVAAMKQFQEEVVNAITANDMKWKQRAKQHWLKHGDRNTQYFHMQASQRKKINAVNSIVDSQGRVVTDQSEIGEVFTVFFSSLFTTSQPLSIDQCLQEMDTKLDMDMKAWLLKPFTREEITAAVFKMNPLGSPGPDGFPAQFYQKNWEVVGDQVCNFALQFLNHGGSLSEVNDTFITLIPKVQNPTRVAEYRPISLCNVIYKVVSKTMANRLKHILPQIIAPNQSAFVPGRVEWDFIEAIMTKMDFPGHWIHITKSCLSSVSYSVLVNGEPQEKFAPSRGLRQGDPLSPYLFILCAEGLSSLLKHAEACGNLTPVTIGRGPIKVSHLFFADDSLLFCQAKYEEINCVLKILELYEKGSGQVINKDKSAIFFSKNTTLMTQQQIKSLAGVQSTSNFEKYLGLPSLVGRKKIASFHSLIDRTWSRVSNWRTKFLSAAGKEILLKVVLQAIPTYAMGMFLLPASITRRLNQILRRFWWGFNEDSSKIQWVKWEQLSGRKDNGGLGFRDLKCFNIALLSKQGWRILQNPTSLVAQILKQKYFKQGSLLDAKLGTGPSFAWRGIHTGLSLLKKGISWRVGNGKQINIWHDRWIPSLPGQQIVTPRDDDCWCDKVSDIIDPQLKIWQESLLDELFSIQEREGIKAIPISLGGREDKLIWQFTPNGIYTVKSGYYLGKELEREKIGESSGKTMDCLVWRSIWKLKVPPATRMFVWRACSEVLPTMANLKRRKVIKDSSCLICKKEHETSGHALWGCSGAQDVWSQGPIKVQKSSSQSDLFFNIWAELIGKLDSEELNEAAITLRLIWARRNDVLHGKAFKHPREIIAQARTELTLHNETMQKMVGDNSENMTRVLEWTKPAAGCLKVNWDVAVQMRMGRIGIGVIIRDHHGLVIGALRANRPLKGSVFDAEAYGLLLACVFCKEIGVRQICLEGDSKQVVDQMNQDSPNWSLGGCLISDAKEILNLAAIWSISHAYREANMAAHMLAQAAYECTEDMYDIEICPACICQDIAHLLTTRKWGREGTGQDTSQIGYRTVIWPNAKRLSTSSMSLHVHGSRRTLETSLLLEVGPTSAHWGGRTYPSMVREFYMEMCSMPQDASSHIMIVRSVQFEVSTDVITKLRIHRVSETSTTVDAQAEEVADVGPRHISIIYWPSRVYGQRCKPVGG
ncbi:uncharacterized protein LOC118348703 [Juglans regia]|uniref:Uncharacterized protein LOC118348703 n=1 Tax=Juglans regia TaxID=51240 RepID=A0A6P9EEP1_JUGRE|nr:uncharacterized protein LOC118348703 [Juglans regia]